MEQTEQRTDAVTGWRIEGTLREFPKFPALNIWFEYPVHKVDFSGVLGDLNPDEDLPSWKRNFAKSGKRAGNKRDRRSARKEALETAFGYCDMGEGVTVEALAEYMDVSEKTVRNYIKESGVFRTEGGRVFQGGTDTERGKMKENFHFSQGGKEK